MATNLTLTFVPNFNTASLYVNYTILPSTRVSGTMRYRHAGRDWLAGHGLVDLPRKPSPPDQMSPTLATSLFGLVPGESVDVEVTFLRHSTIDGTLLEKQTRGGTFVTRSDSFVAGGPNTWYLSINGNNGNTGTSPAAAWHTPFEAARKISLQAGDTIVMLDGDYAFFDVTGHYNLGDTVIDSDDGAKSGEPGKYITLKAETPGGVKIRGSKAINFTQWGQYTITGGGSYNKVYQGRDGSGNPVAVTQRINRMRFKPTPSSTGTILYPYKALVESGSGENTLFGMSNRPWPGWFQDSNGYVYVKLDSGFGAHGPAPQTNQLSAAAIDSSGLYLIDVAYWKLEGIIFEDFGIQDLDHVLQPYRGLDIRGVRNVVVDNCTFRDCPLWSSFHQSGGTFVHSENVTIQNSRFEASGIWPVCDDRLDPNGWSFGKNTPLNVTHLFMDFTRGGVIRRNAFDGSFYGVVIGTGRRLFGGNLQDGGDIDIHNNTFHEISGDNIAVDYPDGATGTFDHRMTRIFLNDANLTNFGVSLSPMNVGPVFCVANRAYDFVDAPFKPGNGLVGNPSAGWKFLYHNTCKSTVASSYGFKVNVVTGNIVATNNIFQGAQQWMLLDSSQQMMTAPNAFIRNVFFSSSSSTPHWLSWRGLSYAKAPPLHLTAEQALMDPQTGEPARNPNEVVLFDLNIEELNPFPSGGDTALNTLLMGQAVPIPGITNIAGTATGVYLAEPLAIGRFGSFTMPPRVTSPTATLARRLIPMLMQQQTPQPIS